MKHAVSALVLSLLLCSVPAFSQEGMEAYMEMMKPGPEHELLEKMAGSWELEGKIWQTPGAQPMEFSGKADHHMILGGRFVQMDSKSGEGEMYTESMVIMGYDRRHKEFTYVGFDTWGTYFVTAKGAYDKASRSWSLEGQDVDPVMGFTQNYIFRFSMPDDDRMTVEVIFIDFPGVEEKEYKMLEMNYSRL